MVRGSGQIDIENVYHRYNGKGSKLLVLNGINFKIKTRERLSIVGPSGCGKTTLINIISGILKPTNGKVTINGQAPQELIKRRAIGLVFQDSLLLPWRTVAGNIKLPMEIAGMSSAKANSNVEKLLGMVKLEDYGARYPRHLSGGMRSRVSIARSLANSPEILIMDEPFGALDELTTDQILFELISLNVENTATVIMVTHNIKQAVVFGHRVIVLSKKPATIAADISIEMPEERTDQIYNDKRLYEYINAIRGIMKNDL